MSPNENIEILLVEDNRRDADLALRVLKKNYPANEVEWVRDGEEAIEFLLKSKGNGVNNTLKLILLDLKMPKVDGVDLLRKIRSTEHTQHIPVVMLTSSQEEKDIATCYDLGINSYIVKPMDYSEFADALKDICHYWLVLNNNKAAPF